MKDATAPGAPGAGARAPRRATTVTTAPVTVTEDVA
ncbi:hypothetical protein SUDANB6_00085 [Streptomyces sp. enrichment culture]